MVPAGEVHKAPNSLLRGMVLPEEGQLVLAGGSRGLALGNTMVTKMWADKIQVLSHKGWDIMVLKGGTGVGKGPMINYWGATFLTRRRSGR
jgi:hypothetical protein